MSLILDALKKSEAERQLGRAPGLTTPMPLRRGEADEGRFRLRVLMWIALLFTLLAAALWLVRSSRSGNEHAGETTPPSAAEAEASSPMATAPPVPVATQTPPVPAPEPQAPPADPVPTEPDAQAGLRVVEAEAATPQDPTFPSTERETQAIVAPTPAPAASSPPIPASAAVISPPASERSTARTLDPLPQLASHAAAPTPAPGEGASQAAEAPLENLPRLDQLGGPQRDALPPLKQTMHVYSETPDARFVLIDGHRYREGDRVTGSLQLLEIRRDGTVLQFDGLRFLLPRP